MAELRGSANYRNQRHSGTATIRGCSGLRHRLLLVVVSVANGDFMGDVFMLADRNVLANLQVGRVPVVLLPSSATISTFVLLSILNVFSSGAAAAVVEPFL